MLDNKYPNRNIVAAITVMTNMFVIKAVSVSQSTNCLTSRDLQPLGYLYVIP